MKPAFEPIGCRASMSEAHDICVIPLRAPARMRTREQDASDSSRYTTAQALAEFERWSRSYDRSWLQRLLFEPTHRLLLSHLSVADRKILDIGCGTGRFLALVAERFPEAEMVGLDICPGMLRRAQPRCQRFGARVRFVRGDSANLPFDDGQFDVVTCSHSFHHYPDQQRVVREMYRVLRPNGRVMLVDGDRDGWWGWLIYDVCVTWVEGGVHHCSAEKFRRLFRTAGFRLLHQTRHGLLAPFLLTIATANKPAPTAYATTKLAA